VVVASSIARGQNLAETIYRAGGGLVEPAEAHRLADSIDPNANRTRQPPKPEPRPVVRGERGPTD